jgi:hypothetical protein
MENGIQKTTSQELTTNQAEKHYASFREKVLNTNLSSRSVGLEEVRKLSSTPIASLVNTDNKENPKFFCHAFIVEVIDKVCGFFGATFSANQKVDMAKQIYASGYFIKELEWALFVSRCMNLHYNPKFEMKGTLYPATFMSWFNLFLDDVLELNEKEARALDSKIKDDSKIIGVGRGFESIEEYHKAIEKNKEKEALAKTLPPPKTLEEKKSEQLTELLSNINPLEFKPKYFIGVNNDTETPQYYKGKKEITPNKEEAKEYLTKEQGIEESVYFDVNYFEFVAK